MLKDKLKELLKETKEDIIKLEARMYTLEEILEEFSKVEEPKNDFLKILNSYGFKFNISRNGYECTKGNFFIDNESVIYFKGNKDEFKKCLTDFLWERGNEKFNNKKYKI